jgi:uncharacterized protein (UPF0548 family)
VRLVRTSRLEALIADYERLDLTYPEVGSTRRDLPSGYHHTRLRRPLGRGKDVFRQASDAVLAWDMQRGAGMRVAVDGPAVKGRTVVAALGSPIGLLVPCRVIYVVDEPRQRGFGYGTLPGHPEHGEEAFIVTIDDDEQVWLEITAFSRPGSTLVKLAGPLNKVIQQWALRRYHRALLGASQPSS